jgi:protoporphyrinogen oxidase
MTAGTQRIAILGSGMAGLGAAHCLRSEGMASTLYDKNPYPGGHTASHHADGFIFDEGPHVSFTRNERIRRLFADSVGGEYQAVTAAVNNYWQGHWVRHPAITNLHGLPPALVVQVIQDFIDRPRDPEIRNYADWLNASYGEAFARTFPMQYTRKYHTTPAENMSTEWVGPRLYQARLEEVLLGAVSPAPQRVHYVQDYRYPTRGGFASFLSGLTRDLGIELGHRVTRIDPRARTLRFANGAEARYDALISSLPLPELVPMIVGAPPEVLAAADTLACTTVVLVNLGIARPDVSQASWTYFYDEEFPFSRISFPAVYSPHVVPEGTSSIQAEVYFSKKYRPLTQAPESLIDPVIDGLTRAGVMRPDDRVVLRQAQVIPYANIIFDLDRAAALGVVHGFLEEVGVTPCGRYGEWGYHWTDEAFISGEAAARRVLDRSIATAGAA